MLFQNKSLSFLKPMSGKQEVYEEKEKNSIPTWLTARTVDTIQAERTDGCEQTPATTCTLVNGKEQSSGEELKLLNTPGKKHPRNKQSLQTKEFHTVNTNYPPDLSHKGDLNVMKKPADFQTYQVCSVKKGGELTKDSGLQVSSNPSFTPYRCEAEFADRERGKQPGLHGWILEFQTL